jgi:two-component system, LytTR family, response regulator LytT
MKILIVEDELLIAEMLKEMLIDLGYEVIAIANNYNNAIEILDTNLGIDMCFIDINLQEKKSGFDVVNYIINHNQIPFVFCTSYSDKKTIEEAVKYNPEAYLIKPFSESDLFTTIELIKGRRKTLKNNTDEIIIKDGHNNVKLQINDILWIKSDNVYIEINTDHKKYLVRNSLVKFLDEINSPLFAKAHRAFAININHIQAMNSQYIIIANEKIPLSRNCKDEILEKFKG